MLLTSKHRRKLFAFSAYIISKILRIKHFLLVVKNRDFQTYCVLALDDRIALLRGRWLR